LIDGNLEKETRSGKRYEDDTNVIEGAGLLRCDSIFGRVYT